MEDRLSNSLRGVDRQVQQLERAFDRAQRASSRLGNTNVRAVVHIDTTRIEAALNRIIQRLDTLNGRVASPTVILNNQTQGPLNQINNNLRQTTGRRWDIVLGIKDGVTNKLNGIKESLSAPIGMLGMGMATMGAGALAAGTIGTYKEFEHQMKAVQAISGATGSEFEALTAKAREMGATTSFSATEAGKAFEYMAMAGWKTDQMLAGIPGILSLAAASGEELGKTSDIVTDAMTAFHMAPEEAAHFSDVLAQTASNANTNVGMMGYTFQYLASTAGTLGYSIEDVSLAIGTVANAGIKGEKAGTGLLAMLNGMISPSKEAAATMDRLGLSITDAEGNIKPFRKLLTDLRTSFAGLSKIEQAQAAASIAGVDGMKSMQIIANTSQKDFDKLANAIDHASDSMEYNGVVYEGAAQKMAAVRIDSLEGDLQILNSAWQDFQIGLLSDGGGDFLRGFVKSATETISEFGEILKSPEFKELDWGDQIIFLIDRAMEKLDAWASGSGGEQFGKVLTKLAEIGIKAFASAFAGLLKAAIEAALNGNLTAAAGLGLAASMVPGAGLVTSGVSSAARAIFYNNPVPPTGGAGGAGGGAGGGATGGWNWGRIGTAAKWAGRIAKPVQAIFDANRLYESEDKVKTGGEVAGGWAGMLAGAKAGAVGGGAIGAAFGGVGAAPGAAIGGLLGGIAGYWGGSKLGGGIVDSARDIFGGNKAETPDLSSMNISPEQLQQLSALVAPAGISGADTANLLATLGKNGLSGEAAGASMASFVSQLAPVTEAQKEAFAKLGLIDEQGKNALLDDSGGMKSLAEIADILKAATENMTQEEKTATLAGAFGEEGLQTANILAEGGSEAITPPTPDPSFFDSLSEQASAAWDSAKETVATQGNAFLESAGEWFNGVKERAGDTVNEISEAFSNAPTRIEEFLNAAGETLSQLPEKAAYSIGETAGRIVSTLEALPEQASEKFNQLVTEADTYLSELPGRITTWVEQTEAEAIAYLEQLDAEATAYFNDLVTQADAYISALPGQVSAWFSQTATAATTYAAEAVNGTLNWFSQLPGMVGEKMSAMYNEVSNWASNIISGITNWFSQIPGIIGGYFDNAISAIRNKVASIKASFSLGFSAGAGEGHAEGGIFNREHIARFAEGNKPEAVIPLDISKRSRGLALLEQVQSIFGLGDRAGESEDLFSRLLGRIGGGTQESGGEGFSLQGAGLSVLTQAKEMLAQSAELLANAGSGGGFAPAMAMATAGGGDFGGGGANGGSPSFNFSGINFSFGSDIDEEELAISIGRRFLAEIRQGQENRG